VLLAVADETRGWQNRDRGCVGGNSARETEAVAVEADDAMVVDTYAEDGIKVSDICHLYLCTREVARLVESDA
jgi:hypothetical protein